MQKLSFKKASDILAERRMSEHQMNLLKGGLRCISCHRDMEPSQMGESTYRCTGNTLDGKNQGEEIIRAKAQNDAVEEYQGRHHMAVYVNCVLTTAGDPDYY